MKRKINHLPFVGLEGLTSPLACHRPKMFKIFGRCLTLSSTPSGHPLLCRFLENLCRICAESLLKKRKCLKIKHFRSAFVGITGLEPATSRPPDVCATNCAKSRFCGCKGKQNSWKDQIFGLLFLIYLHFRGGIGGIIRIYVAIHLMRIFFPHVI